LKVQELQGQREKKGRYTHGLGPRTPTAKLQTSLYTSRPLIAKSRIKHRRQATRKSLYEAIFSRPTKYACYPELSPDWDSEEEEEQQDHDPQEYIGHLRLQDKIEKRYRALSPAYLDIQIKEQQAELERYKKTPVAPPTTLAISPGQQRTTLSQPREKGVHPCTI